MSIYSEVILDHYQYPRNYGRVKKPDFTSSAINSLCGDKIELTVKIKNDKITEIKFQGSGCVLSQAAASMLVEYVKGKSKNQLKKIDKDFIIKMLGINLGVNRIKCALLALEALKKIPF